MKPDTWSTYCMNAFLWSKQAKLIPGDEDEISGCLGVLAGNENKGLAGRWRSSKW